MSDDETTEMETTEARESTGMSDMSGALAAKIAQAMAQIDSIPKRGHNSYHGYEYATADDVMEVARNALGNVGVAVFPEIVDETWSKSGDQRELLVTVEYLVVDGDTGDSVTCRWRAQAQDKQDKAYYKAYTQARKYFLRELLNMSTGEPLDVEFDGGDRGGAQSPNHARGQRQSSRNGGQTSRQSSQSSGGQSTPDVDRETQTKRLHALLGEVTLADRYQSALRTYIRRKADLDDDAEWSEVPASHIKGWADKIGAMDTDQSGGPSERNRKIVQLCKSQGLVDDTDAAAE